MKDKETKLTGKQIAFIEHYTGDSFFNATDAARKAGYKGNSNTLGQMGDENLKKPKIKAVIAQKQAELVEIADITRQECIDNARWLIKYGKENNRSTAFAQGNDQLCKIAGIFTENLNTTDTQRQRELDEREKLEAERIASIRLQEFKVG